MQVEVGQKLWCSKYALSRGIEEVIATSKSKKYRDGEEYITIEKSIGLFYVGKDVHILREDAVSKAETARIKKIASLRKKIAKLEKMVF